MESTFSKCRIILQDYMDNPDYVDFKYPVRWKELGLLDYPTVIKQPMDFGTIDKKLNKDVYKTPTEFIYDMRLIYKNCMRYNIESSELYHRGKQYMEDFERKVVEQHLFDYQFRVNPIKSEERIQQFRKALLQSKSSVMDCVFTTLRIHCPECIEMNTQTVNLDKIDGETLDYLLEFLVSMKV